MQHTNRSPAPTAEQPPKPRYDFYTLLPEQTIDIEVDPDEIPEHPPATGDKDEVYLLQAGSFKQREDADRRRAELLLLGLNPKVEQVTSDSGNWFRVYLGPFESRLSLNKARGLTASQNIDTLLLRRAMP
ncbi:MAG: sporulation protein [Halieaceae bacterium]|nr:sporulation protein [Halieaceae bacterium]